MKFPFVLFELFKKKSSLGFFISISFCSTWIKAIAIFFWCIIFSQTLFWKKKKKFRLFCDFVLFEPIYPLNNNKPKWMMEWGNHLFLVLQYTHNHFSPTQINYFAPHILNLTIRFLVFFSKNGWHTNRIAIRSLAILIFSFRFSCLLLSFKCISLLVPGGKGSNTK